MTDGKYKSTSTTLTVIPFLRFDNYNPKNTGLEIMKPGAYLFSYDMLDHYGFFASAAANLQGDRDLFFTFDFNGVIPGLFQLGWDPGLSLEAYNVTRESESFITLPLDTIPVPVTYNLIEFDAKFRQKVVHGGHRRRVRLPAQPLRGRHQIVLPPGSRRAWSPRPASRTSGGTTSSSTSRPISVSPSRTQEINPVGTRVNARYDYEFNDYDPTDQVDENGALVHVYQDVNFHRLELGHQGIPEAPGLEPYAVGGPAGRDHLRSAGGRLLRLLPGGPRRHEGVPLLFDRRERVRPR